MAGPRPCVSEERRAGSQTPVVVVVMGVAGVGKTAVGRMLAANLEVPFLDADDFHDPECLEKMRRGEPLTDEERAPWLGRLNAELKREVVLPFGGVVLACSALKEAYRRRLGDGLPDVRYVHLVARPDVIRARLESRPGGGVGPELLESQLQALEAPAEAITADATEPPEVVMHRVLDQLRAGPT